MLSLGLLAVDIGAHENQDCLGGGGFGLSFDPGYSFHSRPFSFRPPDFGRMPPHCLKKKATPSFLQ